MSLPLKIKITRINLTKTMNFAANMSVTEACKHIREKISEEGGQDHGLFQPAVPGKHGARWLKPDRTLQYYDLQPNDELEYKKKHRPIKVKLQDETIKTVLVDDTLSVGEIVLVIGEKMSISNAEEFSLKVDGKDEWLNGTLSLQEQGVPEEAMLLLRKKFFVSDAQVSVEDPVSLHLVYVESRDHILAGHHPCSQEEAVMFAALQLQIQLGNYDPNNPKKFNLKDYLPPQFHKKIKNFEPLVIKEYRKLVGMQEANAKYRYVQVCRSLKTYGMTFYNVKQKIKGQKKGKPVALGITRASIIFMDPETKEVTKEAPLTHLRRWAAAPTTFTLDFGDHEDDYLVLVTNEGEAISSLLSGYIDILLKKRNDVASINTDDDAQYAQEEPVAPIKAKAMTSTTTSIIGGFDGYGGQQYAMNPANQGFARTPGSYSQQAVPTNLVTSVSYIASIISDFGNKNVGGRNTALTPEQWRKQLISNTEVLMGSVAKLTASSSGGKFDKSLLDGKAAEIASNLAQLIAAAKNAAVKKNGEDDADLLDGARRVAEAIRDLLAASKDLGDKPDDPKAYEKFTFAQKALSAAVSYMNSASRGILADTSSQKLLMESAKSVLDATFDLVNAAKDKASTMNDNRARDLVNNASDRTETSAKQLNTEVAILAPSVLYSGVRKQIEDTAHNVETSMRQLMAALPDDPSLLAAAKLVTDALMQLLATTSIAEPKDDVPDISASAKEVLDETARLMNAQSQQQINTGIKSVIAATTKLVTSAKQAASLSDDEMRERLLACAKGVASATQKLVAASGPAASNPGDKNARDALNEACQRLAEATKSLIGNAAEKAAFSNLRSAAKIAAAATTGLISNSRAATASCNDPVSNENLKAASKVAQEAIQRLVQALQNVYLHPEDRAAQQALVKEAHDSSPQAYKLVAAAKSALPKVNDPSIKSALRQAADDAADALQKLVGSHKAVMLSSGQKDVDEALERFAAEEANLDSTILAAASGDLQPDSMQTAEGATQLLNMATKAVANAAKNMATTAKSNPDELGVSAKSLADAISQANSGATQLASFSSPGVQKEILEAAKGLTRTGKAALTAARAVAANPTDPNLNNGLTNATKAVADALSALLNSTKGVQTGGKDVDEAIQAIQAAFGSIQAKPSNAKEFSMHAEDLENNIKAVQSAVSALVFAVKNNPRMLGPSAKTLASTVPPFIQSSNQASGSVPDPKTQNEILGATRNVASALQRLLNSAKNATTKDDPNLKNELANAAKTVSDSLDALTRSLNAATPGQAALDEAIKILTATINKLASNAQANINDTSASIEDLKKGTTTLGDATKNIITFVKSDFNKLGESSKIAANAVNLIADATRSLAETGGRTSAYASQAERVREVSRELANSCSSKDPSAKQGIVKAAKDITTSTQELVDYVKNDASRIEDDAIRNGMMGSAHGVATATSGMVNAAKAVAQNQPQAREKLAQSQQALNDALDSLLSQDAGKITTPKAKKLVAVATDAATGTKRMVEISKGILRRPTDAELQTELTNSARSVGVAIKGLLEAAKAMGEVDLDQYIEKLSQAITDLDSASITATVGLLENSAPPGKTTQSLEEDIVELSRELANSIKDLVTAQKESPASLAKAAAVTASIIPRIADLAKQCAGSTTDQEKQQNILGLAKGIADSSLDLMQGCKQNDAKEVATQAKNVSQAIAKLLGNLKSNVISQRDCDEAIKMVTESGKKLDMPNNKKSDKRYAETQKLLTDIAKQLVSGIAKVVTTSKSAPQEVGDSAKKVAVTVDAFVNHTQDAMSAISEDEAKKNLLAAGKGVMGAVTRMIQTAKIVASDPKNAKVQQKMSLAYKEVTDAISTLVSAIKQAATGELKCEAAAESVARNVSELDGAALYAATGQLQPERDDLDIEEVQNELLASCDQVAEEVKKIISSTSKGENELGDACQSTAEKFDKLTKDTKTVASLLNNLLNQQNILGGAKSVGASVQALILSSLKVHQSPQDPNEKQKLVNASQQVSNSLKEFVTLAQNASSAASQGIKELETARKAIASAVEDIDKKPGNNQSGATDVLKTAKGMADAIGVILATCGSNEEASKLVKAAEDVQDNSIALLANVKGALRLANPEQAKRLMASTKTAVEAIPTFLEAAKNQRKNMTPDTAKATGDANEEVVRLIGEMVEAAKVLPGSEEALKLFQETDELERLAESELLNAATAIETAAKTLLDAKEKQLAMRKNKDTPLPDEQIAEAILDAAKAITVATGVLVGSATAAQKELVSKGKVSQAQNVYRRDPAWAKGLISAAQQVAGSVGELVISSNSVVSGRIEEEALVAAAKGVAAATARLVFASRAKADPFSPTQQKLSAAAKSVATATQQLVLAAKSANEIVKSEEEKPDWDNQSAMAARKAEMEQQMQILKLQKELENAQKKLGEIRKAEYADSGKEQQPQPAKKTAAPPQKAVTKTPSKETIPTQSPPTKQLTPTKSTTNLQNQQPAPQQPPAKAPVKATPPTKQQPAPGNIPPPIKGSGRPLPPPAKQS